MVKLVSYENGSEVIVSALKDEKTLVKEFFGKGVGRNIDEYDRRVIADGLFSATPKIRIG